MRKLHPISHVGSNRFPFPPTVHNDSLFSASSQHLLSLILLILVILTSVKRYFICFFIVILICVSLMISDTECLFTYLLAIWMSSLEKYLFRPSKHFFNWIIWSFLWIELYEFLYFGYLGEFLILQQTFVVAKVLG